MGVERPIDGPVGFSRAVRSAEEERSGEWAFGVVEGKATEVWVAVRRGVDSVVGSAAVALAVWELRCNRQSLLRLASDEAVLRLHIGLLCCFRCHQLVAVEE
jgi:hypothetical protein